MGAHSVEMKPAGQVMQEVFLSPRVLDRQAFDTFADALRALIEQAAAQTADLAAAATRAEAAQRRLAEQQALVETKVASTQTALQLVSAQAEDAKRLLGEVEEAGLRLRTIELATSRGIDDAKKRLADFELAAGARLREAVADMTAKIAELEGRINTAEARMRALSTDGPVTLLRSMCERAERLLAVDDADKPGATGLAAYVRRGERMMGWTRDAMRDLDQLREQCLEVRTMVGQSLLDLVDTADRILDVTAQQTQAATAAAKGLIAPPASKLPG